MRGVSRASTPAGHHALTGRSPQPETPTVHMHLSDLVPAIAGDDNSRRPTQALGCCARDRRARMTPGTPVTRSAWIARRESRLGRAFVSDRRISRRGQRSVMLVSGNPRWARSRAGGLDSWPANLPSQETRLTDYSGPPRRVDCGLSRSDKCGRR
jgi:hypothetical protein